MRIDTHQHFWRYDPREYAWIDEVLSPLQRDFLPEDSAPEMAALGFDACIAVQARQTAGETPWLLQLADTHPAIAGVIGWVDLQADDARERVRRAAAHPKLLGLRHVVQDEPDGFLSRPAFLRGVGVLAEFGLTYDVLIYERQMPAALEFVRRFPEQRFVLDHVGKPDIRRGHFDDWARQLKLLAGSPNVTCKLSGLVTEADWRTWTPAALRPYVEAAAEYFSPERLLVGSDWPVCTVAGTYASTMAVVMEVVDTWPAAARDAVLGGNATRLWDLPR
jgi:L-fuconolactonase